MPIFSPEELARHLEKVPAVHGPQVAGQGPMDGLKAAGEDTPPPADPHRLKRWLAIMGGQMFDAGTTTFALNRGATEGNPIMRPFADKPAAFYPIKAGVGALIALMADRAAKKDPKVANGMAIGTTVGSSIIGARNIVNGMEHGKIKKD